MADEAKDKANMFYLVIVSIVAVVAIVSMLVFFAGMRKDSAQVSFMPAQASGRTGQNQYAMPIILPEGNSSVNGSGKNIAGYQSFDPNVAMYYQSAYGLNSVEVEQMVYCNMYAALAEQSAIQCSSQTEMYIQLAMIVCGSIGQQLYPSYYWNHYYQHCTSPGYRDAGYP
jgi:hypothetical protein